MIALKPKTISSTYMQNTEPTTEQELGTYVCSACESEQQRKQY